jgi:predicted NUDIX family NTP pyrophosphohydrolase
MEWPPRSGKTQTFVEIDRAGWFGLAQAAQKIHPAQLIFVERLAQLLQQDLPQVPEQASLF